MVQDVKVDFKPIKEWHLIEHGGKEYRELKEETILEYIIDQSLKGPFIVITDECFPEKFAYYINGENLLKFIKEEYPKIYNMDFFQPSDLVILSIGEKYIGMIHHEGYYCRYKE